MVCACMCVFHFFSTSRFHFHSHIMIFMMIIDRCIKSEWISLHLLVLSDGALVNVKRWSLTWQHTENMLTKHYSPLSLYFAQEDRNLGVFFVIWLKAVQTPIFQAHTGRDGSNPVCRISRLRYATANIAFFLSQPKLTQYVGAVTN